MKKFLSLILAITLVASLFTVNVMAANTVTIVPSKTEKLVAGESITVEVKIDTTLGLTACDYELVYDQSGLEIDTTKNGRIPTYLDKTWLDGMNDTDGDWGYYLGSPQYTPGAAEAETGKIAFAWAGSEAVEADYAVANRVIGKFTVKVKADAADGSYQLSLTGNTMIDGANMAIVSTPVTVTVGEGKQEDDTPAIDEVKGAENTGIAVKEEVGNFKYDNAYAVEVDLTADVKGDVVGVEFVPAFMSGSIDDIWKFAAETTTYSSTWLGEGGATLKAALINIPIELLNETFTIKARAFVKNGADKTYFGTIVEQEVTYTVD